MGKKKIERSDTALQYSTFLVRYSLFSFYFHRIAITFPDPPPEVQINIPVFAFGYAASGIIP